MLPVLVIFIANQEINCLIAPRFCLISGSIEVVNYLVQAAVKL